VSELSRRPDRTPTVWDGAADALPGVARIAGTAALRSASWAFGSGVRSARNLARAMTDPAAAGELVRGVAEDVAEASRTISSVATAVSAGTPLPRALLQASMSLSSMMVPDEQSEHDGDMTLRERGELLLRRSRDVWSDDEAHPAYGRILEELAPDEARILVLLVRQGPQPTVDVRTGGLMGLVSSSLVAARLTMIGAHAGCRYVERVPSYLNNLERLGLIWFPLDPLRDPVEYQVLEAQPDVVAAAASVRRSRIVRRSIHLTPFGEDFCRDGLGLQASDEDQLAIPKHASPGVA